MQLDTWALFGVMCGGGVEGFDLVVLQTRLIVHLEMHSMEAWSMGRQPHVTAGSSGSVQEAIEASSGDIFVWRLTGPDHVVVA